MRVFSVDGWVVGHLTIGPKSARVLREKFVTSSLRFNPVGVLPVSGTCRGNP